MTPLQALRFVTEHRFRQQPLRPLIGGNTVPQLSLFVLGVDELIKCPKHSELITEVGQLMDNVVHFIQSLSVVGMPSAALQHPRRPFAIVPVVTSLSEQVVTLVTTQLSNRKISWLPLGPLDGAAGHILKHTAWLSNANDSARKAVHILCANVSEHGRMLEYLMKVLASDSQRQQLLNQGTSLVSVVFTLLRNACMHPYCSYRGDLVDWFGVISAALLGVPVSRAAKPVRCALSYDDLLANGYYIDGGNVRELSAGMMIPMLSQVQLMVWADNIIASVKDAKQLAVAASLHRLFNRGPAPTWEDWERFVFGSS